MKPSNIDTAERMGAIIGASSPMRVLYQLVEKGARVDMPLLITGETGTGKELVARELHYRSRRAMGPYVIVNTGALSRELVASEIFGHVRGAFTSATENKTGRYEEADNGTLFLDEVGTMDDALQVTLLRVVEYGTYRPVGAKEERRADVRLIAATNIDLDERVGQGRFREDLLHRIKVLCINVPPLRDRKDDIPLLARHFLEWVNLKFGFVIQGIDDRAIQCLMEYPWPGNVRELKNTIAQAAVVAESGVLQPYHLPPRLCGEESLVAPVNCDWPSAKKAEASISVAGGGGSEGGNGGAGVSFDVGRSFEELDKEYALLTLAHCNNNKTRAAKLLGVSRKTLHERLARWEVRPREKAISASGAAQEND